jgi:hypothetical protein
MRHTPLEALLGDSGLEMADARGTDHARSVKLASAGSGLV